MSDRATHLDWAERNRQFAATIKTGAAAHADWAVTAVFYSAVHLLEAYLAGMGEHPGGHGERSQAFQDHSVLVEVWEDYREMKDYSEDARYRCVPFVETDVDRLLDGPHLRVSRRIAELMT